MKPDKARCPC